MKQLWQKLKTIKVTRRMIVIWVVSFVGILVIGFGSAAMGLSLVRYNYGQSINYDNVFYINYKNEQEGKQLTKTLPTRVSELQKVVKLINKSGKTNKLEQLFKTTDEHVTYENTYTSTFTASQKHYIIIRFNKPQYSVADTDTRNRYTIVNTDDDRANSSRLIYEILIPLDRTENMFQEQVWYLVTQNPMSVTQGGTNSMAISHKFITYGNYHELGNEIKELRIYS